MPRVWNLGNTTIRNPNRIEEGLKIFAGQFQNAVHGAEAESEFARALVSAKVVDSEGTYSDLLGRKWRSVFVKLGLATQIKYHAQINGESLTARALARAASSLGLKGEDYELTPVGLQLMAAGGTPEVQDVFLRQLVCHEIPSPIEKGFGGGSMKPFVFILQVLRQLQDLHEEGLSKLEIAIFLQSFLPYHARAVHDAVGAIQSFRKQRTRQKDQAARRRLDSTRLQLAAKRGGVKPNSLIDYADTTVRYSQMSGLVTTQGERLILRSNRLTSVDAVLSIKPQFIAASEPLHYLERFYSGIELPMDDVQFLRKDIASIRQQLRSSPIVSKTSGQTRQDAKSLQRTRLQLLEELNRSREETFAREQITEVALQEILDYLTLVQSSRKSTDADIIDRPAYLEWLVWRSFLAIDHFTVPSYETRRFPLDEDMKPRHPAPGGDADMVFEFKDYVLVVEVTLTTSSRQEAAEGEPVRRHVASRITPLGLDVYGLFIAPDIDTNTAETFRRASWYVNEQQQHELRILPLTLSQFSDVVAVLKMKPFGPADLRDLLTRGLAKRHLSAPAWKAAIGQETQKWIADVMVSA